MTTRRYFLLPILLAIALGPTPAGAQECVTSADCGLSGESGARSRCCCGPSGPPTCTITEICPYAMICGGECCNAAGYVECGFYGGGPSSCEDWELVQDCVPPNPDGTCGAPPDVPACDDSELTDQYVGAVNTHNRCVTTVIPLGSVEGAAGFSVDVAIVYNEARPVPAELADGTDAYGVGGWLSTDQIITDEGVSFTATFDEEVRQPRAIAAGSRGDDNGNEYVGYTLHTPWGSRTYDHPVVLEIDGKPAGVFRSEPFDGWFLRVEDKPDWGGPVYTRLQYPAGPYEIYDQVFGAGPLLSARLLRVIQARPTIDTIRKSVTISRSPVEFPGNQRVTSRIHSDLGWSLKFEYTPLPDGSGRQIRVTRDPLPIARTVVIKDDQGGRVAYFTQPGRWRDDGVTLTWDAWRLASALTLVWGPDDAPAWDLLTTYHRGDGRVTAVDRRAILTARDLALGMETTRFGSCDVHATAIAGTRVLFPRNDTVTYEYGDDRVGRRLVAYTDETGVRTEYRYRDRDALVAGELSDAVQIAAPGDEVASGVGTHIDWGWLPVLPTDASLFPAGTFLGPVVSGGIPVPVKVSRYPDQQVLARFLTYDSRVFRPTAIVDERGHTRTLAYYPQTGLVHRETYRGLTTQYRRGFVRVIDGSGERERRLAHLEVTLLGAPGVPEAFLGAVSQNEYGFVVETETKGRQFAPGSDPRSRKFSKIYIEKRIEYDSFGIPHTEETSVDGVKGPKTLATWDPRGLGVARSTTLLDGEPYLSLRPLEMADPRSSGRVDGLGAAIGAWEVTGPGEQLTIVTDPAPGEESQTVNGLGTRTVVAAGDAPGTVETQVVALEGAAEIEMGELTVTPGKTDLLCE